MPNKNLIAQPLISQWFGEARRSEAAGKFSRAIEMYQHVVRADGRNIAALVGLARVAAFAKDMRLAIETAARITAVAPRDLDAAKVAASISLRFNRPDKALTALAPFALQLRDTDALKLAFEANYQLNHVAEAERVARLSIEIAPDDPASQFNMGRVLDVPSHRESAIAHYASSIQTGRAPATAYLSHAWAQKFSECPPYFQELLTRSENADSLSERSALLVTAGKIMADIGEYDQAFGLFLKSKAMFAPRASFASYREQLLSFKRHFDGGFFAARRSLGNNSQRPVFVFGMPRSGTTLVEQILSAHPEVAAAGELMFFEHEVSHLSRGTVSVDDFLKRASSLRQRDIAAIAADYLALLRAVSPTAPRVVDKMPNNFERLWLMAIAFPKAKFIHCKRDPVATCFSCLTNPLSAKHAYTSSLEMLGDYYHSYEDLTRHWTSVLPVDIAECGYESLVANFEFEARRLIEFVGLEWSDRCLNFQDHGGLVLTPSRQQVARGVYSGANDGWRKYESHLGPLMQALTSN